METVVIQETDKDILEVLYAALELEGFSVYALLEADSDFLELIDKARPHVIMLDFRFSGEECMEVARKLKNAIPTYRSWP
jgi:DNA-binding response OmpR family regulator